MQKPYGIGLDIGSHSVGWTVVDLNGKLLKVKGKTAIGARLFKEGTAAADRRKFRTTRRRLKRRKWRLRLLREIFDEPINKIDPEFFARRHYSGISPRDSQYNGLAKTLFNDRTDKSFYDQYPTIYHLRQALADDSRKFDIREIYLAIAHIVKSRGNFLQAGGASHYRTVNVDLLAGFKELNDLFAKIDPELDLVLTTDAEQLAKMKRVLLEKGTNPSDRQKDLIPMLATLTNQDALTKKRQKAIISELAKALVGNKTKVNILTMTEIDDTLKNDWSFKLGNSEDNLPLIEDQMSELGQDLIERVVALYSAINLARLIPEGSTFSESMIARYNQHKKDLAQLKQYINTQDDIKRRHAIRDTYDRYISGDGNKAVDQETFYQQLSKLVKDDQDTNPFAADISRKIITQEYMPKLRTKANGLIPYQIQQINLDQIITNQKKYYPWLGTPNLIKSRQGKFPYKLDELIAFRIPYYVGPLITTDEQRQTSAKNFAWMVRKKTGEITPWNFEEKVDREASATAFIQRMKTTDTYLIGEDVVPQHSLVYQRFMVLNELNKIKIDDQPITVKQKQRLYEQVFKKKASVRVVDIQRNLVNSGEYRTEPKITGLSDPKKFNSSLSTYFDLSKIIPEALQDSAKQSDIEQIIAWSTIFEDASIFKLKLTSINWLTDKQRQILVHKRYRGWGQLSNKLLVGFRDENNRTIMDGLWATNQNFMELRSQPKIAEQIQAANQQDLDATDLQTAINGLYTSPQNKKAIREVMLVVEDVKKAMHGQAPTRIFIEAARGGGQKGRRTKSRSSQIQAVYQNAAKEIVDNQSKRELAEQIKNKADFDDKLVLYFMQNRWDPYNDQPLNIDDLPEYQIDHILPQSFIKDDSLDNRVLTRKNQEKREQFAMEAFGTKFVGKWQQMHRYGLISSRKLRHLMMKRSEIDQYAAGFINRQLVETRQVIKLCTSLLDNQYPDAMIVSVKADLTHQFRQTFNFPKIRDLNNYHHAFDAYLTAFIGTYLIKRYPKLERFFVYGKFAKIPVNLKNFNIMHTLKVANQPLINQTTGEIIWDKLADLKMLTKIYNFKRILVTREVYENHAAMFDQTIYKASQAGVKKLIPKKLGWATDVYGGYSGQTSAYLAIVKVPTKQSFEYQVVGIPMTMLSPLTALHQQGVSQKDALTQLLEPLFTRRDKKTKELVVQPYEVVLPEVRFEQMIRDQIKNQTHRFLLGKATYYHNAQELYLPLSTQRLFEIRKTDDEEKVDHNLTVVFDEIVAQVNRYFSLYDMNKFRSKLTEGRTKFLQLKPLNQMEKNKLVLGKQAVLTSIFAGLHANATSSDLKVLNIKTPFGKLQVPNGIKLTNQAQIIYQSPTGLYERVVALNQL